MNRFLKAGLSSAVWAVLLIPFLYGGSLAAQEKPRGWVPESPGAPKVGEKVPDFTLPDSSGKQVTLSEFIANGEGGQPGWVLLIFYRGYW